MHKRGHGLLASVTHAVQSPRMALSLALIFACCLLWAHVAAASRVSPLVQQRVAFEQHVQQLYATADPQEEPESRASGLAVDGDACRQPKHGNNPAQQHHSRQPRRNACWLLHVLPASCCTLPQLPFHCASVSARAARLMAWAVTRRDGSSPTLRIRAHG